MTRTSLATWSVDRLREGAVGVSASRRTDVPALYARWFERRLEAGEVEYIPAGPPRRVRRSLRPGDVTHFNFWSKWPRPFLGALDRVLERGYPVLWNITITGLGQTAVEPHVPATDRAVDALLEVERRVGAAAIQWRYDPVFLSERYDETHHLHTFRQIASALSGHVDRVAVSFLQLFGRRVAPDLRGYEQETGDRLLSPPPEARVELLCQLRDLAHGLGIPFTVCCAPALRAALDCPPSACNAWSWATRVYPDLTRFRPLRRRPTRPDCVCSQELDLGVYDTCTLGCRYSYGTCREPLARTRASTHDPSAPCILP